MPQPRTDRLRLATEARITDPLTNEDALCRKIQPYQANKAYTCPECGQEIFRGQGHFVVVPGHDSASRRHWHEICLKRALSRRYTGSNHSKGKRAKRKRRAGQELKGDPEPPQSH